MPRVLTAAMSAAVAKDQVRPAWLATVEFASGTTYWWTGTRALSWNGHTWSPSGEMGSIRNISETAEVRAQGIELALSGISSDLLGSSLGDVQQGKDVEIYLALLDLQSGALISDPVQVWGGRVDSVEIRDEGATSTIVIKAENDLVVLEQPRIRRYTNADQQSEYPTDRGFEWVEALAAGERLPFAGRVGPAPFKQDLVDGILRD